MPPSRIQRRSHGAAAGTRDQRTTSGPSGSANQRGTRFSMPGSDAGTQKSGLIAPPLPSS